MAQTIRELIKEKSELLRYPDQLENPAKELVELSSLLSSLNREISDCQFILNQKRAMLLEECKTVAKAKLMADASPEWRDWFDRITQKEAVMEMIRSLKYMLRSQEEERKESVY